MLFSSYPDANCLLIGILFIFLEYFITSSTIVVLFSLNHETYKLLKFQGTETLSHFAFCCYLLNLKLSFVYRHIYCDLLLILQSEDFWFSAPKKGIMVFALPGEPGLTELAGDFKVHFHDRQGDFYWYFKASLCVCVFMWPVC